MSIQKTKRYQIFSKKFGNTNESKFLCHRNCSQLANIRNKRIFLIGLMLSQCTLFSSIHIKRGGVEFATNDKAFFTPIE